MAYGPLYPNMMGGPGGFMPPMQQPQAMPMQAMPPAPQPMAPPRAPWASRFADILSPEVALPMAGAMIAGRNPSESFGNAFMLAGQGLGDARKRREEQQTKNSTVEWLKKNRPDLAGMVEAGMPVSTAWQLAVTKPEKEGMVNAGDGQLYDPNTGKWISAPGGSGKAPEVKEFFDEDTGQPYKAIWNPETRQYERFGGIKAPNGMTVEMGPDGTFRVVQGPQSGNVNQNLNAGFLIRSRDAHQTITKLEEQGTSLWNKGMRAIPGGMGNYGLSPEAQKFDQAKRDFVNAVLRRESGAVISDEEFANADQQYFPQPGDGPQVIAQKRRNRENAIKAFEISAGPAAPSDAVKRYRFNPETSELE